MNSVNPKTILLIDDDADDQDIFKEALKKIAPGTMCHTAFHWEEAEIKLKDRESALPAMIFLDLNLPRLNGKECLVEIKKMRELSTVPVIIYTTSSSSRDKAEVSRLGADHFMTKHHSFNDLCDALSEVFNCYPRPVA